MNRVLAIAPDRQYLKNWLRESGGGLPESFFIYVDDPDYLKGWTKGVRFIWIQSPHNPRVAEQTKRELRILEAVNLPLDTKEWPLTEFPQDG